MTRFVLAVGTARASLLEAHGFRQLHTPNDEVRDNMSGVIETILGKLGLLNSPMTPFPKDFREAMNEIESSQVRGGPPSGAARHILLKAGQSRLALLPSPFPQGGGGPRAGSNAISPPLKGGGKSRRTEAAP